MPQTPSSAADTTARRTGQGVMVERRYTEPGVHPFDQIEWEIRDAVIGNPENPAFEQRGVEFP
jgi:ribonucleoside-diphosphate reductase alpha chain